MAKTDDALAQGWKIELATGQDNSDITMFVRGPGGLRITITEQAVIHRQTVPPNSVTVIMRAAADQVVPSHQITLTPNAAGEQGCLSIGPAYWMLSPDDTAVVEAALRRQCHWCSEPEMAERQCHYCDRLGCAGHVVPVDGAPTCDECDAADA